jgi:hypothetical protein
MPPDAMPDMVMPDMIVTAADRDLDGIPDDQDNCPDVANSSATDMQANEDGDRFGDACDPCPQIADDSASDADGDHIGDACDPNPGLPDTVWRYEGFHDGLPAWSRSMNWTAVADKARVSAPQNTMGNGEYMFAPFAITGTPDNFAATTTVTVDQMLGTSGDHSLGLEIYDKTANRGIECGLDQAPAGSNSILFLDDYLNNVSKSTSFAWAPGTEYRLALARHGRTYRCSVVDPGGTASLTTDSNIVPRDGNSVDFWAYGMVAQLGSIQIIGTP